MLRSSVNSRAAAAAVRSSAARTAAAAAAVRPALSASATSAAATASASPRAATAAAASAASSVPGFSPGLQTRAAVVAAALRATKHTQVSSDDSLRHRCPPFWEWASAEVKRIEWKIDSCDKVLNAKYIGENAKLLCQLSKADLMKYLEELQASLKDIQVAGELVRRKHKAAESVVSNKRWECHSRSWSNDVFDNGLPETLKKFQGKLAELASAEAELRKFQSLLSQMGEYEFHKA